MGEWGGVRQTVRESEREGRVRLTVDIEREETLGRR